MMPHGLLVAALRAERRCEFQLFFAGGAGLLGACSPLSDTLLGSDRLSDEGQPPAVFRALSAHRFIERLLKTTRDRTGLTVADPAAIDFADRRHFNGGAGEEQL